VVHVAAAAVGRRRGLFNDSQIVVHDFVAVKVGSKVVDEQREIKYELHDVGSIIRIGHSMMVLL